MLIRKNLTLSEYCKGKVGLIIKYSNENYDWLVSLSNSAIMLSSSIPTLTAKSSLY